MKTLEDLNSESTIQDFIEFYEAIPEEKWTTEVFKDANGCGCAFGHLGATNNDWPEPCRRLQALVYRAPTYKIDGSIIEHNDGHAGTGSNPKERVLNMLKSLI